MQSVLCIGSFFMLLNNILGKYIHLTKTQNNIAHHDREMIAHFI